MAIKDLHPGQLVLLWLAALMATIFLWETVGTMPRNIVELSPRGFIVAAETNRARQVLSVVRFLPPVIAFAITWRWLGARGR